LALLGRRVLLSLFLPLLPPSALAETAAFRFAWLSDTHVGASTGDQDLLAAVRDINSLTGLSFDFSVNSRYPKVRALWTYDTGYTIASTSAVWKDMAIVGDASGKVYALSLVPLSSTQVLTTDFDGKVALIEGTR